MLRTGLLGVAVAAAVLATTPARAGPVLDRVRAGNVVRCGAEERPGFAAWTVNGVEGLGVDLCRAAAIAVLGTGERVEFCLLDREADFDAIRDGLFDIVFLTGGLVAEHRLAARVVPGPPIYVDRFALMVASTSTIGQARDLVGKTICFMIGSPAQRALEAAFEPLGIGFARLGFEEDLEMRDAYDAGRCQAVAEEVARFAGARETHAVDRLTSRILDPPLALDPVLAATPVQDGAWSAAVFWLMHGLVEAAAPPSGWHGAGTGLDAEATQALGLRDHWRSDVTGALGSYADMLRRNTGRDSDLDLAPGPNAPWPSGLLLPPAVP